MTALRKGDYVLIESLGHAKHGKLGIVAYLGEHFGTIGVEVGGVEYGFTPHELTKLVTEEGVGTPTPPDLTAEEYNEVMDALMARAAAAPAYALTEILTIADSVKNKFGRHAEHRRTG